jgi:hypothetical protein
MIRHWRCSRALPVPSVSSFVLLAVSGLPGKRALAKSTSAGAPSTAFASLPAFAGPAASARSNCPLATGLNSPPLWT